MTAVGIDLGTTNTVVAAVRDGRGVALKDKAGHALLPSVVHFPESGSPVVGRAARDARSRHPSSTVFSVKRLLGRAWDSEPVQTARGRFPFELVEGPSKATLVRCHGINYTLPEISALVLEAARDIASHRLGEAVTEAVITVPANFNDLQRAATKAAAGVAGLDVLRIINEPTAAALAYGFGRQGRERVAVYDFGGGTFDVTLLDLSENVFEVLSTSGNTFLGGDDIDGVILEQLIGHLKKQSGVDAGDYPETLELLRAAAETLKCELSNRSVATTHIPDIWNGADRTPIALEFTLKRSEFEQLAEPHVSRTLKVCQEALDVAGLTTKDLDEVLLVGGSTRIPLVRRRISSFFGKMPQGRINPDEVVAIGASIQAMALSPEMARSFAGADLPSPATAPSTRPPRTSERPAGGRSKTLMGVGDVEQHEDDPFLPAPVRRNVSATPAQLPNRPAPSGLSLDLDDLADPVPTAISPDEFDVLPSGLLEIPEELRAGSVPPPAADGSVVFDLDGLESGADLPSPAETAPLPAMPAPEKSRAERGLSGLERKSIPLGHSTLPLTVSPKPIIGLPASPKPTASPKPLTSVKPSASPKPLIQGPGAGDIALPSVAAHLEGGLPSPILSSPTAARRAASNDRGSRAPASLPDLSAALPELAADGGTLPTARADGTSGRDLLPISLQEVDLFSPDLTSRAPGATAAPAAPEEGTPLITSQRPPLLLDVTPLSLGVEVVGGFTNRLIERNSPIPCERTSTFATTSDGQAQVRVRVCQGEEETFEQNTVLGEVLLSGLAPTERGRTKINVTFALDENGMLRVHARDPVTGTAADAVLKLIGVS